ncbi:glycosyltransferase [Lichenihabitans sp. Uapishka_5]|uniref:glycosyltransferase n=1 Tax=Lichenihabitans sp. Uapishka_5 TaxID=3037302 RepID=UPI0029E825A7|nr:glycosyltransferase [Lichenihabitans sp. Uapishka_5]MDX7951684.1 glycosyltransferase [Lichenihabitans sp. Uapishka_5]
MMDSGLAATFQAGQASAIVAIPACNEAGRIEACLAALATQRDGCGAPIEAGAFEILVYANNCSDNTADVVTRFAETCPHPLRVVSARHEPARANAGWARKAAMDLAADRLEVAGCHQGLLLTTDADSLVSPTWFAATRTEMARPVDCVAGYIDALPEEIMRLGPRFVRRGRLEDRYLRQIAEIYARCDPRPHDPWPNHRVSSGASLAVTLLAYRAVGGLPAVALGEDAAFTRAIEAAGLRVRHPMSVTVATSCRFDGRAKGGAADTMRLRHAVEEAPCDDDVELVLALLRRALLRGRLRQAHAAGTLADPGWARRLGLDRPAWQALVGQDNTGAFEPVWERVQAECPSLRRHCTLRPADLPRQIARAEALLRRLASDPVKGPGSVPTGRPRLRAAPEPEIA